MLGVVTMLGLTACGDEEEPADGGSPPGETQAPAPAPAESTSEPIADFQEYVGGNPGKASGSPITIGWLNNQGGQQDFSEATRAAQATVTYINEELGGVDGRPLKLDTCFIANAEEEGQRCGQRFANSDDVKAVAMGVMVVGNEAFHSQINGSKVTIVGIASNPVDMTSQNVFGYFGSSESVLGPFGTYLRDYVKAESAAMVYNQGAGQIPIAQAAEKAVKDAGVSVKVVGFDQQATDLLGPITAAGSQTADALVPVLDVPYCINYAKALESSGIQKPVVSTPLCIAPPVADALGDLPQWTYGIALDLPGDLTNPAVKAYNENLAKYGLSQDDAGSVFSAITFSELMALAKIMNELGADNLTTDKLVPAVRDFKGPMIMGPPDLQCGKYPETPGVCSDQTQFFDYKGKGKFVKVAGWLRPPAATG